MIEMAMSTQRASSSLLSAESAPRWKHDVFLSFRGADTRVGFISHLYDELQYWQTIRTFKDDKELEVGASISPELLSAIEQSHLAIVVLSPNYATSGWCLDELAKIFESMETRDNAILPVFFHVDPCDVRYQRGSFAHAFAKHEERYGNDSDKLKRWRAALTKVASLSGWDLKNYESERELIKLVVKCVWRKVRPTITLSHSADKLVGIDFGLGELGILLAPEVNDVRFIGIWGMGGIGKTTLAKLVFERISHQFEVGKFLLNVREVSSKHGTLVNFQKQLLYPILKENIAQVWDEQEGTFFIRKCFSNKKVLLILDDVDHVNQLQLLAGKRSWFGAGSRIIVTTRDERLFIEHDIEITFKVVGLNDNEALELFSQNACKKDQPDEEFLQLSKCFIDYAKGLPLALKVLGRSLYKRGIDEWISALDKLKNDPDTEIFSSLKLSYDGLCEMSKSIFLDVAFLHKGKNKKRIIDILDRTCDFSSLYGLNVLIEKSLLTIERGSTVEMHDLIQEMAWEIVRRESHDEPGRRSRLCHRKDIYHVFSRNTGTKAIQCIRLCLQRFEQADSNLTSDSLSKMLGLTFLEFDRFMTYSCPKFLPNSLKVLIWSWYPSKFLPASFRPNLLTELRMENSNLVELWDGKMDLPNLKYMDLRNSKNLTKTPDVTGIPNLEVLELRLCTRLVEIHPSIAIHKKLRHLELHGCAGISSLPREIEMYSLELLGLAGCSKVKRIPEFGSQMKRLLSLKLSGTAIEIIPSSIRHQVGLVKLELSNCNNLSSLPCSIVDNLKRLKYLDLDDCSKLDELPENLGKMESLEELRISGTAITEPPHFITLLRNLKDLHFRRSCIRKLDSGLWGIFARKSPEPLGLMLPSLRDLRSLESLNLVDHNLCQGALPDDIGYCMPSLEYLYLSGNNFVTLPASIKCLSKLLRIELNSCKRLQQLPELPSNSLLQVKADNCDSLNMLSEPSKVHPVSTNLCNFTFSSVNCNGLVDNEGWNDGILLILRRLPAQGISPKFEKFNTVTPGSQILGWFSNQSKGDSLIVELPPDSCSRWMGIAFCAVTADLGNSSALENAFLGIECLWNGNCCNYTGYELSGCFMKAHLWIFYMPREEIRHTFSYYNCDKRWLTDTTNVVFSFKASYRRFGKEKILEVKKCGARLVCQQDLNELLYYTVNRRKRTREYSDEAGPSGNGGSNGQSLFKRLKGRLFSLAGLNPPDRM